MAKTGIVNAKKDGTETAGTETTENTLAATSTSTTAPTTPSKTKNAETKREVTRGNSFFGPGFIDVMNHIIHFHDSFQDSEKRVINAQNYPQLKSWFDTILKREKEELKSEKHLIWIDHLKLGENAQKYFTVQNAFVTYEARIKKDSSAPTTFRVTQVAFDTHCSNQQGAHDVINTAAFTEKTVLDQYTHIANLVKTYGRLNDTNRNTVFTLLKQLKELSAKNKQLGVKKLWNTIPSEFKKEHDMHVKQNAKKSTISSKASTTTTDLITPPDANMAAVAKPLEGSDASATEENQTPSTATDKQAASSSSEGEWHNQITPSNSADDQVVNAVTTTKEMTAKEFAPIKPEASTSEQGIDPEVAALTAATIESTEPTNESKEPISTCGRDCLMKDVTRLQTQLQAIEKRLEETSRANTAYESVYKVVNELSKAFETLSAPLNNDKLSPAEHQAAFKQFAAAFKEKLADKTLNDTIHQQRNTLHMIPVIQQIYAVVKAICGLLASITVLPVCNLIKWATDDKTPVFSRGIYGTFFSQETFTAQDINSLSADIDAQVARTAAPAA